MIAPGPDPLIILAQEPANRPCTAPWYQVGNESYVKGTFEGLKRNETVAITDLWAADSPNLILLMWLGFVIVTIMLLVTIYCCCPKACPVLNSTVGQEIAKPESRPYQGQTDFDPPPDYSTLVTTTRSSVPPQLRV